MMNAQFTTTLNSTETVLFFFEETIYVGYDFIGLGCAARIVHHNREAVVCQPCGYSASDPTIGARGQLRYWLKQVS